MEIALQTPAISIRAGYCNCRLFLGSGEITLSGQAALVSTAHAVAGRPATPMSYVGVARPSARRRALTRGSMKYQSRLFALLLQAANSRDPRSPHGAAESRRVRKAPSARPEHRLAETER